MQNNSTGKTALVSGGTRGIGRAISLELARSGFETIFLNYLQQDAEARNTLEELKKIGIKAFLIKANLALPEEIDKLFETVKNQSENLDVFVHSAALGAFKPLIETKANQWNLTFDVNARSFLLCVQHCVNLMPNGSIVAISSLGSIRALQNYGAIGPSKAALESMVRSLAVELAPRRIRVNCVSGGFILTDSIKNFPGSDLLIDKATQNTPAGRIGRPQDIADAVMFLISRRAEWIIGQTLIVDGGISLR